MATEPETPAAGTPAVSDSATDPTDELDEGQAALVAVLMELERHVRESGWDQPPRLFALVPTAQLIASEPGLTETLGLGGAPEGSLTAVEQDHFQPSESLLDDLAAIEWPEGVHGCALALERTFLPARLEPTIPDDPAAAARFVAEHPERQEVRVLVGADRGGRRHGVARLASRPDELLAAENLVPGLGQALAHTLN